jgi:hypothetical protein
MGGLFAGGLRDDPGTLTARVCAPLQLAASGADSAKIRAGFRALPYFLARIPSLPSKTIQDSRIMNRTLLVSAFLAIALTACGKKEQAPAPAAPTPAPAAAPAADVVKPADAAAPAAGTAPAAPATTEKKAEQKN